MQIYGTDHPDSLSTFGGINLDRRELGRHTSRRTRTRRTSSRRPAGCCKYDDHPDHPPAEPHAGRASGARPVTTTIALDLSSDVLRRFRTRYGENHPDTVLATLTFSIDQRLTGDLRTAREAAEVAVEGLRLLYGEDHPHTAGAQADLAVTLRLLGECEQARRARPGCAAAADRPARRVARPGAGRPDQPRERPLRARRLRGRPRARRGDPRAVSSGARRQPPHHTRVRAQPRHGPSGHRTRGGGEHAVRQGSRAAAAGPSAYDTRRSRRSAPASGPTATSTRSPCSGTSLTRRVRRPASPPGRTCRARPIRNPATDPVGQFQRVQGRHCAAARPEPVDDGQDEFRATQQDARRRIGGTVDLSEAKTDPAVHARRVLPQLTEVTGARPLQVSGHQGEIGRGGARDPGPHLVRYGAQAAKRVRVDQQVSPEHGPGVEQARRRRRQHLPAAGGEDRLRCRITPLPGRRQRVPVDGVQVYVVAPPHRAVIEGDGASRTERGGRHRIVLARRQFRVQCLDEPLAVPRQPAGRRDHPQDAEGLPPPQRELEVRSGPVRGRRMVSVHPPELGDADEGVRTLENAGEWPGVVPPGGVVADAVAALAEGEQVGQGAELVVLRLVHQGHRQLCRVVRLGEQDAAKGLGAGRGQLAEPTPARQGCQGPQAPGDRQGPGALLADQQLPGFRETRTPAGDLGCRQRLG